MAYSWRNEEVLDLLASENRIKIIGSRRRTEVNIYCPVCGENNCYYNLDNGVWYCFTGSCNKKGDSASLAAIAWDLSLSDARKTIEEKLGIKKDHLGTITRPQRQVVKREIPVQEEPASDEVIDDTYRAFLNELMLSQKHRDHLLSRGFSLDRIEAIGYRSFPSKETTNFVALCRHLLESGHTLKGVPGFYLSSNDNWTFMAGTPGIAMPRVNRKNQITGIHIRKDDDLRRDIILEDGSTKLEPKCWWFTSKGRKNGTPAKTAIHYSTDFILNKITREYAPVINTIGGKRGIYFTEGIMKGDLCSQLLPNVPFLCNQGVKCLNDLEDELMYLKEKHGLTTVVVAYDQDYKRNPDVQVPMQRAKEIIAKCGLEIISRDWEEQVTIDNYSFQLKGIDDFLAYHKLGIIPRIKEL